MVAELSRRTPRNRLDLLNPPASRVHRSERRRHHTRPAEARRRTRRVSLCGPALTQISDSRLSPGHRAATDSRPIYSQLLLPVAHRIHIWPLISADRTPVMRRRGGQAAEPTVDPTPSDRGLLPLNGYLTSTAELPNRTSSPPPGSDVSPICEDHEKPCHSELGRIPKGYGSGVLAGH